MTPEIKNRIDQIRRGEAPDGYIKTKLGPVPQTWKLCRIESFCQMKSGDNITSKKIENSGIFPCYGGNGLRGYTDTYTHSGRYVLIGRQGALCGNVKLVDGQFFASEHAIVTQNLTNSDIDFIYFLLDYMNLNHCSESSAQPGLSVEKILRKFAVLPSLLEQKGIAEILTTQDEIIELKEKLIAEKQRQKKYLMQQLLTGKKRLAGQNKKWRAVKLKSIAKKEKLKNIGSKYSLVLSNSAQHGIIPQEEQFDKEIASTDRIDEYYIVRDGYFVYNPRISTTAPCGPININETGHTGVMSPLYTVFSIDCDYIDNSYMKQYFKSTCWFQHMKSVANYGARHDRMSITDDDFFAMPIAVPELEEQQAIAAVFAVADKEISLLQQSLEQEKQKKKALMQLLLTGIVRVNV